ncbi:hypothetical protein APR12_002072 [Nocardia amikacinitolerans]|uniref:hypothetical protein n=1 Tax=Nocardia amikacinitolerans TaxID=756689 RepID=UPI000A611C02|nr:hypothetical protein [Nocardia amikacinitolerans]MCP2316732.1 hypothetical protein [Nocardia amikacinitolerans]
MNNVRPKYWYEIIGTNPNDKRQRTERYKAEWGKKRIVAKGTLYATYWADEVDAQPDMPVVDYEPLSQREQLIKNAKAWAYKKYPQLDRDDISQEIELKAWELEDHLDEKGDWVKPAYIMTSLQNAVHDYARQEIGYQQVNKITDEVITHTRFDVPGVDEEIAFTAKTLKAGLMLFIVAPYTLSLLTKDRLYSIYKMMSKGEHKALLQSVINPNPTSLRSLDRLAEKYLPII